MDFDTLLGRYVGKENVPKTKEAVKEAVDYVIDPAVDGVSNMLRPFAKRVGVDVLPEKKKGLSNVQEVASDMAGNYAAEKIAEGIGTASAAAAGWKHMPTSLKTVLGAVTGLSAAAANTLTGDMLQELPGTFIKVASTHMNKLDETGQEQEASRVGAFTGLTENIEGAIGETLSKKWNLRSSKYGKTAEFVLRTLLGADTNMIQKKYESRNDGETWYDP